MDRTRSRLVAAVLGVGALGVIVGRYRDQLAQGLVPTAIEISHPHNLGATILASLRQQGSDLAKPHSFDFYFYFPRKAAAESAAGDIQARGFTPRVDAKPYEGKWLCLASRRLVPDELVLSEWGDWFPSVAAAHGGEYDGWEAAIEK